MLEPREFRAKIGALVLKLGRNHAVGRAIGPQMFQLAFHDLDFMLYQALVRQCFPGLQSGQMDQRFRRRQWHLRPR